MTSPKLNNVGRSALGAAKRQKILDHLHKVGVPCDARTLCQVTGEVNTRTMNSRLQRMHELEELARETYLVSGHLTYGFTPLVTVTLPKFPPTRWEDASRRDAAHDAGLDPVDLEEDPEDIPQGPWHTIHRCSNKHPPIQAQGGQYHTPPRRASVMASL